MDSETEGRGRNQSDIHSLLARLFARLEAGCPNYDWDESIPPYHSSYDNWHVFGFKRPASSSQQPHNARRGSRHDAADTHSRDSETFRDEKEGVAVVARISRHLLRLEREYKLAQKLYAQTTPQRRHCVRPIGFHRLPAKQQGDSPLVASIFEAPGSNYLHELVEFGPNFYPGVPTSPASPKSVDDITFPDPRQPLAKTPLPVFLNFAVGATECCEILHHGNEWVHGELRGDAFHFSKDEGIVRLINFGSGARSFENGLTSAGWNSLTSQVGVEHKLQFVAPEQTGRMPAAPDSRTDIYSLGILFWTMLTGEPAFAGTTPLDIMQNVLSRRIPPVDTKRQDVPSALSRIIQKMTQKNMDERYQSSSGLKFDLLECQRLLNEGDGPALDAFELGTKDVSSFFTLPSTQIGRQTQLKAIVDVIEKAASRTANTSARVSKRGLYSLSASSTLSSSGIEGSLVDEVTSDSASGSDREREGRLQSLSAISSTTEVHAHDALRQQHQQHSQESVQSALSRGSDLLDPRSSVDSRGSAPSIDTPSRPTVSINSTTSGSLLRSAQKLRKSGRCEVISISGTAGLGKSSLLQVVQTSARTFGYYAAGKFDQVKRTPFEPVFRVMSLLFRQIFSESDVSTDFHNNIRTLVRPVWSALHVTLDLPPWLLSVNPHHQQLLHGQRTDGMATTPSASAKGGEGLNSAMDWLRAGGGSRDRRIIATFLDVLRLLALQKFICLCLDDLQFADEESLDLIQAVITAGIPVVLILTFRSEESLPLKVKSLLENATSVKLTPFTEEETTEYVATTLNRQPEYVVPLVALVQEKTSGNPFFIREMLDSCYRKKYIFYSWKSSQWEFDLDRVFTEFSSPDTERFSSNDFVVRKLTEMPPSAKAVLCWASLIGHSFSYNLVKLVMSCECSKASPAECLPPFTNDPVSGLQSALSAYTIMATEDEDRFRFSHDRYLQATHVLCDAYQKDEMHFVIAVSLMKHYPVDGTSNATKMLFEQCRHVCNAIDVVKTRATSRRPFRALLNQAAEVAREQGAQSIALYFLQHSLELLAEDPWNDSNTQTDAQYGETLTLMTQTAASYWFLGYFDEAEVLLTEIFQNSRDPADRSAAFIIQSRMYAQKGDARAAFSAMKRALADLGLEVEETSWDKCDEDFQEIMPLIKSAEPVPTSDSESVDRSLLTMGAVLVELASAAFWSDALMFYQITIKMLKVYLDRGVYPQLAIAYVHLASIAIARFGMVEFGVEVGYTSKKMMDYYDNEAYTNGRGLTLHALFLGHLEAAAKDQLPVLDRALDATIAAGDKILHLLNLGITAAYRVWSSHELPEIEAYITFQDDVFPHWPSDLRGGVFLMSVRQYVRALQGKTQFRSPAQVMDDDEHQSQAYLTYIHTHASAPVQPALIYDCYRLGALFRFGHVKEALELSEALLPKMSSLWCMRYAYYGMFYAALCYISILRENPDHASRKEWLSRIRESQKRITGITGKSDANQSSGLLLLEAELAELNKRYDEAIRFYEAAIDHAELLGIVLEEGLSYELYAEFLVRRGSTRPARSMCHSAIGIYQRMGATGKVEHLSEKHAFLLHGAHSMTMVDAGTQTEYVSTGNTSFQLDRNEDAQQPETEAERTQAWVTPDTQTAQSQRDNITTIRGGGGLSAVGLDMIDLASILGSSQLLSSELQVDKLLAKLTGIIVESTGAELCGLVVNDEDTEVGWSLAAVSGPEGSLQHNIGQPLEKIEDAVVRQVTLYVLRFRESVFMQNVLDDVRFGNVPSEWRNEHPDGKAIIALPILHGDDVLLGSIYIEGPPRSFTERNTTVLRLLINQISISIANALLFKRVDKVSASNSAMLAMQKQALAQARESERRAKLAEAKAMEMVRLTEEAAKAKSMFLANVSHELRTPLNGVIGMSELLKSSKLDSEQEGYADSIRVCADTLLSVINDILDFSKLEAGKMQMFNVQLSLTETISEVVRALSYTNMERGLKTIELLEIDRNLLVMGDPVRLHQILMNLLSNAYKFTAKGTVTVKAVIDHEDEDSIQVTTSVTDTGIGISEEQAKKLFLPFSQADSSTARSYGGTGLGLSICKAIIENVMKGKIWMSSAIGVGTTVAFSLLFQKVKGGTASTKHAGEADPMAIFTPTESAPSSRSSEFPGLIDIPRDQLRICIAEDNPINQKIAISFVQKLGFKCKAFGDGQQAVDALVQASADGEPFHLCLMDVQMPVLDGYNATREIRRNLDPVVRDVLIIAMTASAIRGDREKCLEAGMNNYLAKPVRAHVLKQMLESYLNQQSKSIPHLQEQANDLAKQVVENATAAPTPDLPVRMRRSSTVMPVKQ